MTKKTMQRLAAMVVLGLCPLMALAAGAQEQLKAFVANVQGATGSFTQATSGAQGGQAQKTQSGNFAFQRPGKFNWMVQKPYEQRIVSDGKQVFQYDPDLAQVTVRQVDQAIGTSPAAILFGSGDLEQAFDVSPLPARDGLEWLRAKPRGGDAGFSQVDIGMKDNQPARIELLDAFGQTTRVTLSNIRPNPSLPASEFQFTPPAGTDVVKM
ncbi:outer membrane lipoprotein chaperone LolA [Bordetella genomosp. 13]|uniref:Outer-membrane lipoprotein carrier protein n=1 Tax=Bordetella genomosp. 13 TaxID=463040 RepID=A0A1W6ZGY2_9BORD|nr:outer membrane lipoprotein chaperone LolA [Bordetella genomosp. 13]ARP96074.1 outer membrane lipoprotein carrier protein LolA [Bordetella genomosp. 13]